MTLSSTHPHTATLQSGALVVRPRLVVIHLCVICSSLLVFWHVHLAVWVLAQVIRKVLLERSRTPRVKSLLNSIPYGHASPPRVHHCFGSPRAQGSLLTCVNR